MIGGAKIDAKRARCPWEVAGKFTLRPSGGLSMAARVGGLRLMFP